MSIPEPIAMGMGWDLVVGLSPPGAEAVSASPGHGMGNMGSHQGMEAKEAAPNICCYRTHLRTTDKDPRHDPRSTQQNLLECPCSAREEVVEHRKVGNLPSRLFLATRTSCPL